MKINLAGRSSRRECVLPKAVEVGRAVPSAPLSPTNIMKLGEIGALGTARPTLFALRLIWATRP